MKTWPITFAVALSGLIAGCAGTTTMNYDLRSPDTNLAAPQTAAINYRLASIEVPESIDTSSLIVRQPDNSLMALSHDKWMGSLSEAFRNGLASALTQNLGVPPLPDSMASPNTSDRGSVNLASVAVKVEQFDMQPARQASLGALWQVDRHGQGNQNQSVTCYSVLTEPVGPGVAALVAAQQHNVQKLGALIANTLKTGDAPSGGNCRVSKT